MEERERVCECVVVLCLWCTCFITKTEVFFFLICALRIVIFGRELKFFVFASFLWMMD